MILLLARKFSGHKVHKEVTVNGVKHQNPDLYIIRPNIDEAAKAELVARFDAVFNGQRITVVVESKDWAKRRFAYELEILEELSIT